MAYNRHVWKDEMVEYPSRYKLKNKDTGVIVAEYDLERVTGEVLEQDSISASKLNNIEIGVETVSTVVDSITTAIQDTGTVNSIVVDTLGTFDLTKNGNVTPFIIPLFTNTSGTVNVNMDGQGNKLVKKANDSGVFVALEVGDIKKNVPCQLVWDSVNDFFIFAPKGGGSNIKSIQRGTFAGAFSSQNISISNVDTSKSIILISVRCTTLDGQIAPTQIFVRTKFENATTFSIERFNATNSLTVEWQVIEFNNVKSVQSGNFSVSGANYDVAITSIDTSKSILFSNYYNGSTTFGDSKSFIASKITNSTSLNFRSSGATLLGISWFVVEFK